MPKSGFESADRRSYNEGASHLRYPTNGTNGALNQ